jgi:hypothetical protein
MIRGLNQAINQAFKINYDFIDYADIRLPPIFETYKAEYIKPGTKAA